MLGIDESVMRIQADLNTANPEIGFYNNLLVDTLWILENRQAFVGGPYSQSGTATTWDFALQTLESGPRNVGINIFGVGVFDCGTKINTTEFQVTLKSLLIIRI